MCGVFAVSQCDGASRITYLGLFALQHRGQESAGITTLSPTGELVTHKEPGLVAEIFKPEVLAQLHGQAALGHVRYSTAGGASEANVQPLTARIAGFPVALAHNGNIVNAEEIRKKLEDAGSILHGTADTEIVLHLLAKCQESSFTQRLLDSATKLVGAFTGALLTKTHLYGYVDTLGYRPLVLGKLQNAWVLSSETCALDLVGAQYVRDIAPGELVAIDLKTQRLESHFHDLVGKRTQASTASDRAPQSAETPRSRCSFEHIYFGRPDSVLWGQSSLVKRCDLGAALAKESPVAADLVMAIPDSGVPIAMGYAEESGIPYKIGLIRNHYVGRTFIEPTQIVRNFRVKLKLNPVREIVSGKRIIVVDDSIVRGTTSKRIIEILREAGAKEVHVRIGSPQVRFPCFYGIDTPKRRELLAQTHTLAEMREYLGADSLAFLQVATLVEVMNKGFAAAGSAQPQWCTSCFSGKYQDTFAQAASSSDLSV